MRDINMFGAGIQARFDTISVHGRDILAALDGDSIRVPMKPFCETIGVPWDAQRQRIQRDEVLSEGASMMLVPSAGGLQEQVTLPLDLIPGFLFGIQARRFAPELRERIRIFRRECYRILHDHFFSPDRSPPAQTVDLIGTAAAARESFRLISTLKRETNPRIRSTYHALLSTLCAAQGIDAPAIGEIGADALPARALVDPFFEGLETLTMLGVVWNHGSRPGEIAFNLAEVLDHFADYGIPIPAIGQISRALLEHGPIVGATKPMISNITGAPMLCWVFRDEGASI
ncbi:MAG: hypothetical protein JWQ16_1728 [Novosphingobium sp.]|nr:hypothetical protein [Novosphingobium sp.]